MRLMKAAVFTIPMARLRREQRPCPSRRCLKKQPLSSSVIWMSMGMRGQKAVHITGSGKCGKRFPLRSIFGALHVTVRLVP